MIIVRILGGLGNQMFQYSFYKYLNNKYKNVKIDLSEFKDYDLHNGFELDKIFNLEYDLASDNDIKKVKDKSYIKKNILSKLRRKIFGKRRTHIFEENFSEKLFEENKDYYLSGYWETIKYINKIETIIRDVFKFKNNLKGMNYKISKKIKNDKNSVSVHIRRGDFVNNKMTYNNRYGICDLNYYKESETVVERNINNPKYYVFSDDIEWVKNNIQFKNKIIFVDWNNGEKSYKDMQLMSLCRHNIIANSSFSWWGAWLNNNENKIVISPNRWFNNRKKTNLLPDRWIKISV